MGKRNSIISTDDLTNAELLAIVERGAGHAHDGRRTRPLAGDVVGVCFWMTSTRTRTAFSSGALRLGAQLVTYGPHDMQTNTGESIPDTGRVMCRMLDTVVARTERPQAELAEWAADGRMSVVNAMSLEEHPTQALTDLSTLHLRFGRVTGLTMLYVGEGNNTAAALALTLSRLPGTRLMLRTPPGYGLTEDVLARASAHSRRSGAVIEERHDMANLPSDVDVVYTTRWRTTGTSKPDLNWQELFAPFQVTEQLWQASPRAVFMHDLPAHRGEEVTAEVLDGPNSIAYDQAEMKMHSAMAVLEWCAGELWTSR